MTREKDFIPLRQLRHEMSITPGLMTDLILKAGEPYIYCRVINGEEYITKEDAMRLKRHWGLGEMDFTKGLWGYFLSASGGHFERLRGVWRHSLNHGRTKRRLKISN